MQECAFSKTAIKLNPIDVWQQPCIAATPEAIGKPGLGRLVVICPGIVGDCLENLGEIALEGKALFLNRAMGLINLEHRLVLNRPARKINVTYLNPSCLRVNQESHTKARSRKEARRMGRA